MYSNPQICTILPRPSIYCINPTDEGGVSMNSLNALIPYFPTRLSRTITALPAPLKDALCEIRLRRNLPLAFSTYNETFFLSPVGRRCHMRDAIRIEEEDMSYLFGNLCEGSVYRHMPTVCRGYLITPEGIRVGICGDAVYTNGKLSAIGNCFSLNIRLPHDVHGAADPLLRVFTFPHSILILSPPGVGKTTLLRDFALRLSAGENVPPRKVALVDERREILPPGSPALLRAGMLDLLSGYSKPDGMEIAVRTLSPDVILCDEIGGQDDVDAILAVQNAGVPLVATAHASTPAELLNRPPIKRLIEHNVFSHFLILSRVNGLMKTDYREVCI